MIRLHYCILKRQHKWPTWMFASVGTVYASFTERLFKHFILSFAPRRSFTFCLTWFFCFFLSSKLFVSRSFSLVSHAVSTLSVSLFFQRLLLLCSLFYYCCVYVYVFVWKYSSCGDKTTYRLSVPSRLCHKYSFICPSRGREEKPRNITSVTWSFLHQILSVGTEKAINIYLCIWYITIYILVSMLEIDNSF